MSEIKLTVTIRTPRIPKVRVVSESEKEVQTRLVKLHQKFGLKRKTIDLKYKNKKADISEYHSEIFKLSQDQFAHSLFANWKKHYLTLDGKKKVTFIVGPF